MSSGTGLVDPSWSSINSWHSGCDCRALAQKSSSVDLSEEPELSELPFVALGRYFANSWDQLGLIFDKSAVMATITRVNCFRKIVMKDVSCGTLRGVNECALDV
eukprot:gnl/MRDRNA2_/MRDRNA2_91488_c0_seq1.p1 gnl/MRDRNA2_/MRDRNA2_91488_c0~~gnl/MRDRNA2_/MRDRNA2_91488_c0_seq1.p1  ORF type:complete len:104 (-),score=11.23 gnl/MRDRNA2_/MRDRNA2_91488_c0_seq1:22-333(-)